MKRIALFLLLAFCVVALAQLDNPAFVGGLNRASSSTLLNGLVFYLRLDGNANDSSVNGNNFTVVSAPDWNSDGVVSSCFATNATPNSLLTNNTTLFTTSEFTASFWIKRTGAAGEYGITGQSGASGTRKWFCQDAASLNRLSFVWSDDGVNVTSAQYLPSGSFPDNTWLHISFVSAAGSVKVYTNGVISGINSTTRVPITNTVNAAYMIGRYSGTGTYFRGMIDEYAYHSRALTASEVLELYNLTFRP